MSLETIKAEALRLTHEYGWTKEYFATDIQGNFVSCLSNKAVAFCVVGFITKAVSNLKQPNEMIGAVINNINKEFPEMTVTTYNDSVAKSIDDIRKLFDVHS